MGEPLDSLVAVKELSYKTLLNKSLDSGRVEETVSEVSGFSSPKIIFLFAIQ